MAKQSSLVIELAKEQLGYYESGKNWTKYAKDFDTKWPDFYNTKKQGAEWCDIFVDWLFCTLFGEEAALRMLFQPKKSCGAGCKFSAQYYKVHDRFDKEPHVGDQIFFGRPGNECHTGIVIAYNGNFVTTIEGNSNNAVRKVTYSVTHPNIAGYGHPLYDDVETTVGYTGSWPTLPKRGYFQKGDKGANVKKMQCFLKWYDNTLLPKYGTDGDFGTETLAAVIAFESREGIKTDGLFGPVCLSRAKEVRK